jgi:hypothetical protein
MKKASEKEKREILFECFLGHYFAKRTKHRLHLIAAIKGLVSFFSFKGV